jgi:hypothetical protein
MKIESSLPARYEQGSTPAIGEGYEKRSVDIGRGRDDGNVLVPVPPQLPDDVVDINGWASAKSNDQGQQEESGREKPPTLAKQTADGNAKTGSAAASASVPAVYVLKQYGNAAGIQAGSSAANLGDVAYPKGSMIDVWA